MKKTVFTICSVLTVCAVIIMSCEKEDNSATKVYYNTQPGYSTGGNPNPTGAATSGGSATTTGTSSSGTATSSSGTSSSTTGGGCVNAMTVGATCTSVSAAGGVVSGTYRLIHSGSCIQVQITFPGAAVPAAGTYVIVASGATGMQCEFLDNTNAINATGGSVIVTSGTPTKYTYSNVIAGTLTCTGTACY